PSLLVRFRGRRAESLPTPARSPVEGAAMALREAIAALELQHSEAVVVHAASRIFAALAASGQVTEANAAEQIRYCVRTAIEIALETDRVVESDDESGGTRNRLGPLG